MDIFLQFLFWASLVGIFHSYGIYPLLLEILAKRDYPREIPTSENRKSLQVSILMAAHNEEKVLAEKLDSIAACDFPKDQLNVYLGSDGSTDATNAIAEKYAERYPWIRFFPFTQRQGKPALINSLADEAIKNFPEGEQHIFIITDANVIFSPSLLSCLLRHFTDPAIAVVDSHILPLGMRSEGISRAEQQYISREAILKFREGKIWGAMIGPFGGCYAIRSSYFRPVPPNYLVDDFYIVLHALQLGGKAINDLEAICYEGATHALATEFRRKRRIGAGNFQNMFTFTKSWWPTWKSGLQFAFFSHTILRWTTPHLLLIALILAVILAAGGNRFYTFLLFLGTAGAIGAPALDKALKQLGLQILPLRALAYFLWMNAALFLGWIDYLKGIKTNVWQPTQRN